MAQVVVSAPRSATYVGPHSDRTQLVEEASLGRDLPMEFGIARDVMSHWNELERSDTSSSVLLPNQRAWAPVRRYIENIDANPRSVELRETHTEATCDALSLSDRSRRLQAIVNVHSLLGKLGMSKSFGALGYPPRAGDLIAHEALFWASFAQLFTGSPCSTIRFINGTSAKGNWHIHPTGFLGNNTPEIITYITFGSIDSRATLFASQRDLSIQSKYGDPILLPGKKALRFPTHSVVTSKFHYQPDGTYYYPERPAIYESSPPPGSPRFTLGIGTTWDRSTIARRQKLKSVSQLFTFDEYARLTGLNVEKLT